MLKEILAELNPNIDVDDDPTMAHRFTNEELKAKIESTELPTGTYLDIKRVQFERNINSIKSNGKPNNQATII